MKTKFFLCMRPTVIETDDGNYHKPPQQSLGSSYTAVLGKITRHGINRDIHQRKRVAHEKLKYIRQVLSIKSNGYISEGESQNQVQKPQKASKITKSASEALISRSYLDDESVCWKKPSDTITNESKSGLYLMFSSIFFTIFLGKFFGIMCTLVLVCSLYGCLDRKNDGNDGRKSEKVVVDMPEKGSPEHNKRVIMDGLLERKRKLDTF